MLEYNGLKYISKSSLKNFNYLNDSMKLIDKLNVRASSQQDIVLVISNRQDINNFEYSHLERLVSKLSGFRSSWNFGDALKWEVDGNSIYEFLSEYWGDVKDLIDFFSDLKVSKNNCRITDEQMASIQKAFDGTLDAERDEMINKFQKGKITQKQFAAYMDKCDVAKVKARQITKNWEEHKAERTELKQMLDEQKERKEQAILKRNREKEAKKEQKRIARLAKAEAVKKLKTEKAEKARKEREDYIAQRVKKNEEEL